MLKVLIVDDNVPFRDRLGSILGSLEGIKVIGQAGDAPGALEEAERTKPDVIILDIHMPGGSGLDVVATIKEKKPSPIVVMLTVGPRAEFQTQSYLMGADYFFEKSSDIRRMTTFLKNTAVSFARAEDAKNNRGESQ